MKRFSLLALSLGALLFATAAHADTITFGGVASTPLAPSADSYTLTMSSATFTTPGTVSQAGTFTTGNSGTLNASIPFTFSESITVNGFTQLVSFTGNLLVTSTQDTFSINPHGPVYIGGDTVTFAGVTVPAAFIGNSPFTLDASVVAGTPEPSALILCGTGIIGMAGAMKRRFVRS